MTTTDNHAESTADAQTTQGQPELKSIDTGVLSQIQTQSQPADTATPQLSGATPDGAKPDSNAAPADETGKSDAETSEAQHQGDDDRDRKLEPWMRKRLTRAEERGRRQALAEFTQLLRHLQPQTAQALSQQIGAAASVQPHDDSPKTLADFDNDIEAYTDYLVEQRVQKALAQREEQERRQQEQQAAEEAKRAFESRLTKFESEFGPGAWEEVITAPVDIPQQVVELLKGHPRDLWIARYLVTHPTVIDQLRGKPKLEIAQYLAEIDARMHGGAKRELPPKVTKVPPPPPELPSGTSTVKSIDDMTTEERIAEWRRQRQAAISRR
jgi:hypothetical protein